MGEHSSNARRTGNDVEHEVSNQPCRQPVCPVCGGELIEIRQKLHCSRCHAIVETCCEGGRG